MTEETRIVPIRPSSPLPPSEAAALAAEVAKCLKLVAPAGMNAEQQTVWLHAAVDALEDIRAGEVADVSAELRRSVTRPAQIVPEIARLISEKRARKSQSLGAGEPISREWAINQEASRRRGMARNLEEVEAAWRWERNARADAGLHVAPIAPPLSRRELEQMPENLRNLGIARGLLEYRDGILCEASTG